MTKLERTADQARSRTLATRNRILSAALTLFSEKGYVGATTREIAVEAGVAELTLFRHFPKKELIMEELLRSRSSLTALQDIMPQARQLPLKPALVAIAHAFLDSLRGQKDLNRIFLSEYPRYPEQVKTMHCAFATDLFNTLATFFRELQASRVLREVDAVAAAQTFFGIFYAYFISRDLLGFIEPSGRTEEQDISLYLDVYIRGIVRETT